MASTSRVGASHIGRGCCARPAALRAPRCPLRPTLTHRNHAVTSAAVVAPPGTDSLCQPTRCDLEVPLSEELPLNTHAAPPRGKPFIGKVLVNRELGGRNAERRVNHLVIDTGGVKFIEGQSFGVVPPGSKLNSKGKEVPHGVRLYSIASSRYGDDRSGNTCTLCVVRVVYKDKDGKTVRGLCSNYLCDRSPGDELVMTGPSGTALLLPDDVWDRPVVCVSTGTGIAPFRSFWRRLFYDGVPNRPQGFTGLFWMLSGFANEDSVLYGEELRAIAKSRPEAMRLEIALSLEQKNRRAGPEYVQDRIEEQAEAFLELMDHPRALFYFCGLKIMYSSVLAALERIGQERGVDTHALIAKLKKEHRWHVETA